MNPFLPDSHSPSPCADFARFNYLFERCEGAYAPGTLSAYRADLNYFRQWCRQKTTDWLPACPFVVAGFINSQITAYRISTIKRRMSAITFAHRMSDVPTPTAHSEVRLALRRATRAKAQRPEQVNGLTHMVLEQILSAPASSLDGLRDVALVSVGYDTLCRSSEIARMQVRHINRGESGAVSIFIPFSKADSAGNGRVTHLSPATVERLDRWLEAAQIVDGPIFQGLHLARPSGEGLSNSSIRRIVKRSALRAGVPDPIVERLSGHSMRIGAAQDMMVSGFDLLAIMQAGGWRKPDVVLHYVEHAATRRLHERRWAALEKWAGMWPGVDAR